MPERRSVPVPVDFVSEPEPLMMPPSVWVAEEVNSRTPLLVMAEA